MSELSPLRPPARLLMGPGPVMIEPRVYQAMSKPIVGHLDPFFFEIAEDVRRLLQMVFGTSNPVTLAISGSGTAGMETAVVNFTEPGTRFAVLTSGFFCDRIAEIARRQGAVVSRLEKPWGGVFEEEEAREFITREKPDVVAYVHAETSTGALQKGKGICDAAHEAGALVIADCVTSLGGMPVQVDSTGIDIAYSGTQKAVGCPPGLAPITVSPRAMERLLARSSDVRSFYLDLKLLDDYYAGSHRYHHTAPISMFYGLREALQMIAEEGLEQRWERHRQNHLAFVRGIEALGLEMHVANPVNRLWTLQTPLLPPGISDAKIRARLLSGHGIEVLGGFGPLAGKVLRVGLMGASSKREHIFTMLEALQEALAAEGYRAPADGRAAAEEFYGVLKA